MNTWAFLRDQKYFVVGLICLIISYFFLYDWVGINALSHSQSDAYTLQALAWLKGQTYLDSRRLDLELAIYNGNVYVSFPPVPSLFLLPLALIFGRETPDSILTTIFAVLGFIATYFLCLSFRLSKFSSVFWSLFIIMGTNLLSLSVSGSVWFQAQTMSFALFMISLALINTERENFRALAMFFFSLSVGCRP